MEPMLDEAMAELETLAMTQKSASRDYRDVIAARFAGEVVGRMEIRNLWTKHGFHYFRVNWWRTRPNGFEQYIAHSAFVSVEETGIGPVVSSVSGIAA